MSEPPPGDPLHPGQEEIIKQVNEHTDQAIAQLAGIPDLEARVAALEQKYDVLAQAAADALDAISTLRDDMTGADNALHERLDEQGTKIDALAEMQASTWSAVVEQTRRVDDHEARITRLEDGGGPDPKGWQDRDDLMPDEGQCVFGVYDGAGENIDDLTGLLGRPPGLTTIYWKRFDSPVDTCMKLYERGSVPRLELELVTAFGDSGAPMQTDRGSLWKRIGLGDYDDAIGGLLEDIRSIERPIVVSWGHESDLRSEQGAYPKKTSGWKPSELAGDWPEFADAWRHIVDLAAELGVDNIRWFWNMSGGYTDAGKAGGRWDQMFPGTPFVDFVGWDPFDWYGVRDKTRTKFGDAVAKFYRLAWYERILGTDRTDPKWRPLMIGETACCETEPGDEGRVQDAGAWLDDMRAWVHAHPYLTHLIYFSVKYPTHDRRLTGGPGKRAGTERAGKDTLLV